jgi:N6-L-threonylcarbamoyladenine synthase
MAIETSCDETAVAIIGENGELLAGEIASQVELHAPYGGVVPEVASRNHLRNLRPLISMVLENAALPLRAIDVFAATSGPGLATSLMTGACAAKGLALALRRPFLAINHMEGHLLSPFFASRSPIQPNVALIVSGGHTMLVDVAGFREYRLLGKTVDDAAGEAFDKVGKLLGLPYPGGPEIDLRAKSGNSARFDFPRSMLHSGDSNFSFSGLKTAVRYKLTGTKDADIPDLCASFQEAVVDVLVGKTIVAARVAGRDLITVSGGVSCNTRLRERFEIATRANGLRLHCVSPEFSTDNAAMIAFVARHAALLGDFSSLTTDIDPNLMLCE